MQRKIIFVLVMATALTACDSSNYESNYESNFDSNYDSDSDSVSTYQCSGRIDSITQMLEGSVYITSMDLFSDDQPRLICNLNQDWKGVSLVACEGWLYKLLTIKASSNNVSVQYNDTNKSCTMQPALTASSQPSMIW